MKHRLPSSWIIPDWPVPGHVRAVSTSREGGVSGGQFSTFNLSDGVGDTPQAVQANRKILARLLTLPSPPIWLRQVHGNEVIEARNLDADAAADGSMTALPNIVCAVTTADCLPVLFCCQSGSCIGAAHAGWRGLAAGVLDSMIEAMALPPDRLYAWLGPAIGPQKFEVGDEVRVLFSRQDPRNESAFTFTRNSRWHADIYQLARNRLYARGLTRVFGGGCCTYTNEDHFFSYRRDGVTGRMATLIWMEDTPLK